MKTNPKLTQTLELAEEKIKGYDTHIPYTKKH